MDSNSTTTPMEKPQFEDLTSPPESSIRFTRHHRRSHLKSETFRTLVQILNHCYDYSQRSLPTPILQHTPPRLDNDSDKLGETTGNEARDELVGCDGVQRDDMAVDEVTEANETGGEKVRAELVGCDNVERDNGSMQEDTVVDESRKVKETGKEVRDELVGCDNVECDNESIMQEDMVVDESTKTNETAKEMHVELVRCDNAERDNVSIQDDTVVDETIEVNETGGTEVRDELVGCDNVKRDNVSMQEDTVVDESTNLSETGGKEVRDELVGCDNVERDSVSMQEDTVVDENTKVNETRKEVPDELVGCDNVEFDNVSMQEDTVVDESTKVNETRNEMPDELIGCENVERDNLSMQEDIVVDESTKVNETRKEMPEELIGCENVERDNASMQEDTVVDESTKVTDVEGGQGSNRVQMVMDELEHMMNVEGNEELVNEDCTSPSTSSVDNNQSINEIIEFEDSQENYLALEKFLMEEPSDLGQLPVDNDGLHSLSKDVDSSLDKGMASGVFEAGSKGEDKTCEEKMSSIKTDELEQHDLQLMDNKIEKSVCISNEVVSLVPIDGNEEMEEGEIYGELGLCDQSVELLEDNVALEEEKLEDVVIKEMVTSMEQKRRDEQPTVSSFHILDIADDMGNSIKNVSKKIDIEHTYKMAGRRIEDKKADGYNWVIEAGRNINRGDRSKEALNYLRTRPGDIAFHRDSSEENENNNGGSTSTKKDDGVCNKKKRSGSSETRKEKAKRRKKIKRAEKNRQLGVKRLRLQPVLKPKVIKICDHYLKGRCRKGEECSFSHDAVPLTKSTPCCHFARKSCMKGDDCPFDHELSKYPCNNFVSNGSCIRGDDCMFSHKMPVKDGPLTTSNICNLESMSPILPGSSDSKNQLISSTIHWNMDTGIIPCKNTNQNVAETVLKPPAHPPKGMSFLSFGKSPLNDSCKLKQGGSSPKENNNKVGNQTNPSAVIAVQSLNEVQNRTPAVPPKGINFFSFGKAPSDYSSSKTQAVLPLNSENGIFMSPLNNSSKMKQVCSTLKGAFRIGNQHEQSTSETIQNMHEIPKKDSPAFAPPGINPFSLGKDPSNDSSIKQQTRLPINKGNDMKVSALQKTHSASDKLQYSSPLPSMLSVSPLPSAQSLARLSVGHRNMASSAQKALLSTLAFAARYEPEIKMK